GVQFRNRATEEAAEQIKRMFEQSAEDAASEQVKLGEGIERLLGRFVLWLIPMILVVWGINAAISTYEERQVQAKVEAQQALDDLAMNGLRADVKDITLGSGNTYNVTIYVRNTSPDKDIYVMSPTVRGFVQVGGNWQEVQIKPVTPSDQKVSKI